MSSIPTFDGRNPTQYNVDDFAEDMALYWHVKNVAPQRRTAIFDAAIRNPAKRAFEAKRDADNFAVRPAVVADDANEATRLAYHILELTARLAWLREHYQGPAQQEIILASLYDEVQKPNETPQEFYNHIEDTIICAGFPEQA